MGEKQQKEISSLTLQDLQTVRSFIFDQSRLLTYNKIPIVYDFSSAFDLSVSSVWDYEHSVEQYQVAGGTSRRAVQEQIDNLKAFIQSRKVLKSSTTSF